MNHRISREQFFHGTLQLCAQRGSCGRLQVGAILIRDNRVISQGYNGPEKGALACNGTNCDLETSCTRALHAEENVIANCAKHGIPTKGTTLWVSYNPCPSCARLIVQAGISAVVYLEEFRDTSGIHTLRQRGVKVTRYGELPL